MGVTKFIGGMFGNKADRDFKEVQPIVTKILAEYEKLSGISNDELRNITIALKDKVKSFFKVEDDEITQLRIEVENDKLDVGEKEKIYTEN